MKNKEVLKAWQAWIKSTALEKSAIDQKSLHAFQHLKLENHITSEDETGVTLSIPEHQAQQLRKLFVKKDASGSNECKPVFLLFPLLTATQYDYQAKEYRAKFLPLFLFDIRQWLLETDPNTNNFTLPIYSGEEVGPVTNTFESKVLEIALNEIGEDRSYISTVSALTSKPCSDFQSSLAQLTEFLNQKLNSKNRVRVETGFNAVVCEFEVTDYNSKMDLEEYDFLLKNHSVKSDLLLNAYIRKSADPDRMFIPSEPSFGLFEQDHPLSHGQLETIFRVNQNETLTAVQGGPGTGKTTLFKSLIANQITHRALEVAKGKKDVQHKPLLITSTSNKAVDNVIDDLKHDESTTGFDWLYFHGGHKDKIDGEANRIVSLIEKLKNSLYSKTEQKNANAALIAATQNISYAFNHFCNLKTQLKDSLYPSGHQDYSRFVDDTKNIENQITTILDELEWNNNFKDSPLDASAELIKRIQGHRDDIKKIELARSEEKFWQSLMPPLFNSDTVRLWLPSKACDAVIHKFQDYPQGGLLRLFYSFFPGRYAKAWTQIKKVYSSEISEHFNLNHFSIEGLAELATECQRIKQNKQFDQIISDLSINVDETLNLSSLNGKLKKWQKFYKCRTQYDELLNQLETTYPEGDWIDIQRLRFVKESRRLFELSLIVLWLDLLAHKDKVIEVLEHWKNFFQKGTSVDNRQLWKGKLSQYYHYIALAYPIQASTLASVRKLPGYQFNELNGVKPFNLCLVDESSMISVESLVTTLARCDQSVIVGDPLQLRPIRTLSKPGQNEYRLQYFPNLYQEYERFTPATISAYHRSAGMPHSGLQAIREEVVLEEHRRCQAPIANLFLGLAGYKGIQICTAPPSERILSAFEKMGSHHKMFYSVQGQGSQLPRTNIDEVLAIERIIDKLEDAGYHVAADVSIITPYSNQKELIIDRLGKRLDHTTNQNIGTVHQFQGIDSNVIIYSPVIYKPSDSPSFQNRHPDLLNVSISRAKQQFIVAGNYRKLCQSGGYLKYMAESCAETFITDSEHQSPSYSNYFNSGLPIQTVLDCDHITHFEQQIANAKKSVTIITPWIRKNGLHPQLDFLKGAKQRGLHISIFYGYLNAKNKYLDDGDESLIRLYKQLFGERFHRIAGGTHEKVLIIDEEHVTIGSWNWLSHNYHNYCKGDNFSNLQIRQETSLQVSSQLLAKQLISRIVQTEGA